ncbi:MarR family winged helix-turn-helix transcriptional regulator [Agreia sp. COWG]|uniref:MarR family winged helix-turn-helix transcriptional regulator n=1 Tax=Agreia sp. COWG TaxID=2773266 RepID=UPI0019265626|nr:MarR family transcriptional regulator [Agreia sp. COWG]CAD6011114.1 MarR family transcriptional regulator [Agreia sp. COWG]
MTASDQTAETILRLSRSLLGVVARSLTEVLDQVTLPQFRVLILLAADGPCRMSDLADQLGAQPSTFTRLIARLESGGWVVRSHSAEDRREVLVTSTPAARQLVDEVTERRRRQIAAILSRLDPAQHEQLQQAFDLFASAADEPAIEELLILGL